MAVPKRKMSRASTRMRRSERKARCPHAGEDHRERQDHLQPSASREGRGGIPTGTPLYLELRVASEADGLIPGPGQTLRGSARGHDDPRSFELALTHRSHAYENGPHEHNERLEFLGDSILGQAVTVSVLYNENPTLDEGELAKRRAIACLVRRAVRGRTRTDLASTSAWAAARSSPGARQAVHPRRHARGDHRRDGSRPRRGCGDRRLVLRLIRPLMDTPTGSGPRWTPRPAFRSSPPVPGRGPSCPTSSWAIPISTVSALDLQNQNYSAANTGKAVHCLQTSMV